MLNDLLSLLICYSFFVVFNLFVQHYGQLLLCLSVLKGVVYFFFSRLDCVYGVQSNMC